jgi:hypothetical protein
MTRNSIIYIVVVVMAVFVASYFISWILKRTNSETVGSIANKVTKTLNLNDGFSFDKDTPGYETYIGLTQGCSFKDCIPSIDDPEFESINSADEWLENKDTVFVLEHKGTERSYSQRILNRHEIVNDVVSGDPLVLTFCPLCGSALAFERTLDGRVLEFGVSGKLHNNDLIMYDRQTESLWQQITGEAIVGELVEKKLKQISFGVMTWEEAKIRFPNIMSLKRPGLAATYNVYPYGNYESDPSPLFPMNTDSTIHPKTVVFGVEIDGKYKAYEEEKLQNSETPNIRDKIGKVDVSVTYNDGDVEVRILDTGEEVVATRLFWFAWKAFRPETKLY